MALLVAVLGGLLVVSGPAAQAVSVTVRAAADASVEEGSPDTNFGSDDELKADGSPRIRAFMTFNVGGISEPVTRAVLRLFVTDSSSNGPELWRAASGFSESSVTWATQPAATTMVGDLGAISAGQWVAYDVTSVVAAAGTYHFALLPDAADGADFNSDEETSNRPELVLETGSTTTTTATTSTSSTTTSTTGPTTTTSTSPTTTTTAPDDPPPSATGPWTPVDDSMITSASPTANYGARPELVADSSPLTRALLEFNLPEFDDAILRAVLRLYITGSSSDGPEVWRSGAFTEETVTWNTAPSFPSRIVDLGSVSSGRWLEINVASAINMNGGTHAFALLPDSGDGMYFNSKEASSNRPQLVVETGTPPPPPPPPSDDTFQIGLIGDTGYSSTQDDVLFDTIADMNRFDLAFVTHDGDIWRGGKSSCPDSEYRRVRDAFNTSDAPFVYTPGDNEWQDCPESSSGRLSAIRSIFFPDSQTLGRIRMTVARQSTFRENARWTFHGVVFATINEPGSSGGSGSMEDAGIDWLHDAFDLAESSNAAGVMIIWQDNPFSPSGGSLARALKERTVAFGRPVVLVHGDTHQHRIDRPWSDVGNFTRVETYGDTSSGRWVRATIDPDSAGVFSFQTETP